MRRVRACIATALLTAISLLTATASFATPAAGAAPSGAISTPAPSAASYVPVGTAVTGAAGAAGAPLLAAPGQYLDTLPRGSAGNTEDGSSRFYLLRLRRGETLHVSATVIPPSQPAADGQGLAVRVTVFDPQHSSCSFQEFDPDYGTGTIFTPLTVNLSTGLVGGKDWPDACAAGGTFGLQVTRGGEAFRARPLRVEIGYRIEPPIASDGAASPAPSGGDLRVDLAGGVTAVTAGTSYDNAPVVASGRYRDAITSGQTQYFRVHLGWGQRVTYLFSADGLSSARAPTATTTLRDPLRQEVGLTSGSDTTAYSFGTYSRTLGGTSAYAVRYANRTSDDYRADASSIPGDYFISISAGFTDKGTRTRVPYVLAVRVVGAAGAGPSYAVDRLPGVPTVGAPGPGGGSSTTPIVFGALAVLLVGGFAAALVLRRRRPAHAGGAPTIAGPLPLSGAALSPTRRNPSS